MSTLADLERRVAHAERSVGLPVGPRAIPKPGITIHESPRPGDKPDAPGMSRDLCCELYQVAAHALLLDVGPEFPDITQGEHDRVVELLLDVLYEPDRWTAKLVLTKYRLAVAK